MKAKIKIKKEFNIRGLRLDVGVRYWEDGDINGCEDNGEKPKMPFAVKVADEYRWQPLIDVDEGRIVDWPQGTTASVHYKVCDDGFYYLLDQTGDLVESSNCYVPSCLGSEGDYIIMNIDENGHIEDFRFTQDDVEEIIKGDFGYKED